MSKDPYNIVGKEIRAADGGDYGHRILYYNFVTDMYLVMPIIWSNGKNLLDKNKFSYTAKQTISAHKLSYRYRIDSAIPSRSKTIYLVL